MNEQQQQGQRQKLREDQRDSLQLELEQMELQQLPRSYWRNLEKDEEVETPSDSFTTTES